MKCSGNIFEMISIVMNEMIAADSEFFASEEDSVKDLIDLANGENDDLLEFITDFIETEFDVDSEFITNYAKEIKLIAAYNAAILLNKTPITLNITL